MFVAPVYTVDKLFYIFYDQMDIGRLATFQRVLLNPSVQNQQISIDIIAFDK